MNEIIPLVSPVFFLLAVGFVLRRTGVLPPSAITGFKKLITSAGLPATLFISMSRISVGMEHVWVTLAIFAMLFTTWILGSIICRAGLCRSPVMPFFATAYSLGFLGIPLFSMIYGMEHAGEIGIFGMGHETFVWVIFYALLQVHYVGGKFDSRNLLKLLTNPIMIGLVSGLLFNAVTGGRTFDGVAYRSFMNSLKFLADMVTPLILISIGYDLKLDREYMKGSLVLVFWRTLITVAVCSVFKIFIFDSFYSSPLFDEAFLTFVMMPPLYSLPILLSESGKTEELGYVNTATVLSTILSLAVFAAYTIIHAL